jgi:hypothetical protein
MKDDIKELGFPTDQDDLEFMENRVISQYARDITDPFVTQPIIEEDENSTWNPYHHDLSHYPEIFKMYGENYEKYEKIRSRFQTEPKGEQMKEPPIIPRKPVDQSPWEKKYDDYMPKYTGESYN